MLFLLILFIFFINKSRYALYDYVINLEGIDSKNCFSLFIDVNFVFNDKKFRIYMKSELVGIDYFVPNFYNRIIYNVQLWCEKELIYFESYDNQVRHLFKVKKLIKKYSKSKNK